MNIWSAENWGKPDHNDQSTVSTALYSFYAQNIPLPTKISLPLRINKQTNKQRPLTWFSFVLLMMIFDQCKMMTKLCQQACCFSNLCAVRSVDIMISLWLIECWVVCVSQPHSHAIFGSYFLKTKLTSHNNPRPPLSPLRKNNVNHKHIKNVTMQYHIYHTEAILIPVMWNV